MTQGGATTRIALGLAASVLACLMLPAAAQAQYPYDWHAATPPSWFAESTDSSCQPREREIVQEGFRQWSLRWASSPGSFVCVKPIPFSQELGPGISFYCDGVVLHTQSDGSPDSYRAVWSCSVGGEFGLGECKRRAHYAERPLGDPDESDYYDSGGWYDPYTGEPDDCRPGEAGDNSACERAKQKAKKAKKKVRQADTRAEKTKAKNKLKKATKKKEEACA